MEVFVKICFGGLNVFLPIYIALSLLIVHGYLFEADVDYCTFKVFYSFL